MQKLKLYLPILVLFIGANSWKLYLEHVNKPVPAWLFLFALITGMWACSAGIYYALTRLRS